MKKLVLILLIILNKSVSLYAQKDSIVPSIKTYNVGIFAPLYLDSVFNGINYKYTRSFPKFVLPGLDFVQGAQVALDSMDKIYGNINAAFYDSKSPSQNIPSLIRNRTLDSLDIIIGSVRDSDYVYLSQFALQKNIPFISATYPNDAGITANPFVVIVNSTLKAHCEAIYSYILQSHGSDKIFLVRKPGPQEDRIAAYFKNINEPDGKPLLNIQMVSINESFLPLENKLDSVKENIIIGGSLDEKFAARLVASSFTYSKNNAVKVIGMPNWDGFALGKKNALQDFPIYFTSPYYNIKWDGYSRMLKNVYLKKYKSSPSDMAYKGFETVMLFSRLITKYPDDFMSHLNDYAPRIFNDYNFKPVFLSKQSTSPDYFENKHLYFIKAMNGTVTRAW